VARLPPAGDGLFPLYDLSAQAQVQSLLSAMGVPTAPVVAMEEVVDWVGSPFLLMEKVPGRLLPDHPGGLSRGWLAEAGESAQRVLYCAFVDTLADVHRLDWRAAGLDFLVSGEGAGLGGPDLASHLDWWARYLGWVGPGSAPAELTDSLAWCRSNAPSPEPPPSLLWGDARLANVVFAETLTPAAVLDWEMASVGPAEVDVGWFLGLRALAVGEDAVELPGFLGRHETLDRLEALLGRELDDLRWYEVFALVRSTAVIARMGSVLGRGRGDLDWRTLMAPALARIEQLVQGPQR
jgi:aminoglycoside phosphotransferase (APT) family kinase protein